MAYRDDEITQIDQLSADERLAFGALVRLMVAADGEISAAERTLLEDQAAELGEDAFWDMIDQAAEKASRPEETRALTAAVTRQPVRELIYGALFEIATAGTITEREMAVLDELRERWGIVVTALDD